MRSTAWTGRVRELEVYLEVGQKKIFAAAFDWPGWCRSGRDELDALQAIIDYRDRYERAVKRVGGEVPAPADAAVLRVIERLKGDATTDFGAPGIVPAADEAPMAEADLERGLRLLEACWSAFGRMASTAEGTTLARGPRGGGRDLATIRQHVEGAHDSYTRKLGGRGDFPAAARARWSGETPDTGPRGGSRWPPRYAIRRAAWHILDHAWEIEDRLEA